MSHSDIFHMQSELNGSHSSDTVPCVLCVNNAGYMGLKHAECMEKTHNLPHHHLQLRPLPEKLLMKKQLSNGWLNNKKIKLKNNISPGTFLKNDNKAEFLFSHLNTK